MKILADENVSLVIVERLRKEGHHVQYIFESARGSIDIDILDRANQQGELLLTNDKDFGDLIFHQQRQSSGVILMRLEEMPFVERAEIVVDLIKEYQEELLHSFTVIAENKKRVLRLLPKQGYPEIDRQDEKE